MFVIAGEALLQRQEPLTLTLSRKREREPFSTGWQHSVSRYDLPLSLWERLGEGKRWR